MNRIERVIRPTTGIAAVLVGIFLILGGQGHLGAMLELVRETRQPLGLEHLPLMATGGVLLIPGLLNLGLAWWILGGRRFAVLTAFLGTLAAFAYLFHLFVTGVPDHPIATFVMVVGAYLVLLVISLRNLSNRPEPPRPD